MGQALTRSLGGVHVPYIDDSSSVAVGRSATRDSSASLWSLIAPFDPSSLPFTRLYLWPYLSDSDGVNAMCVNKSTVMHFGDFPILHRTFTLRDEPHAFPTGHVPTTSSMPDLPPWTARCFPCVTVLSTVSYSRFRRLCHHLTHLIRLEFDRQPIIECIDGMLPSSLLSLTITYNAPYPITRHTLPPHLTHLHLREGQRDRTGRLISAVDTVPWTAGALPMSLLHLTLEADWPLSAGVLPPSLLSLHLLRYNRPLEPGSLPPNLVELRCGLSFNHPLSAGVIPPSLLRLHLESGRYDHSLVDAFSVDCHLTTLVITSALSQPLTPRTLPPSLTELDVSGRWDQPLDGLLPSSLIHLHLPHRWSQPLTTTSLASAPLLQTLDLGDTLFNHRLPVGVLHDSLTELTLPRWYSRSLVVGSLPTSLRRLTLGSGRRRALTPGVLPPHLQYLLLADSFDHPLHAGVLPTSLVELHIHSSVFNQPLSSALSPCSSLTVLDLRAASAFNQPFQPGVLPSTLTTLDLSGTLWNHPLTAGVLPSSLLTLHLSRAHTTALVSASFTSCPQLQVLSLEVSGDFDQCIGVGVLPSGLLELALPRAYRQPVSVSALPVSVLRLRVPAGLLRPEDSRARFGTLTVECY